MLTIPTVRVLRSASVADEVVAEAGAVLGCDKLRVLPLVRLRLERDEKLLLELT